VKRFLSSGLPALDRNCGGFPEYDVTLVTGGARSGKTTIVLRFVAATLEAKTPVCLITTEAPGSLFQLARERFSIDFEAALRSQMLTLLAFGPNFESKVRSLGEVTPSIDELGALAAKRGFRALAVDTLDPILSACDLTSAKRFAQEILFGLRRLRVTALCTAQARGSDAFDLCIEELRLGAAAGLSIHREGDRRWLAVRGLPPIPFDLTPSLAGPASGAAARTRSLGGADEPMRSPLRRSETPALSGNTARMQPPGDAPRPDAPWATPPVTPRGTCREPAAPAQPSRASPVAPLAPPPVLPAAAAAEAPDTVELPEDALVPIGRIFGARRHR
jgi:hypothetical protein